MHYRANRHILLLAILAVAACAKSAGPRSAISAETTRSGAALASLVVDNATPEPLVIAFRHAAIPGGEVVVGRVAGASRVKLAPVPAGEPVVLLARTSAQLELLLPPRTFDIDSEWVWVIPADADFRAPGADER